MGSASQNRLATLFSCALNADQNFCRITGTPLIGARRRRFAAVPSGGSLPRSLHYARARVARSVPFAASAPAVAASRRFPPAARFHAHSTTLALAPLAP